MTTCLLSSLQTVKEVKHEVELTNNTLSKINEVQTQYFVDHPLTFSSSNQRLRYFLTNFWRISFCIFTRSCAKASSSLIFFSFQAAFFKFHQRFSTIQRFKSVDWDGYSRTFQEWFQNQALVDVHVCSGSLPPKSNNHQTSVYILRASQSSTCQSPDQAAAKHPKTGSWSMGPNRSSWVSSFQKTNAKNLFKVFLAYSCWLFMCLLVKNVVQQGFRDEVFACLVFFLQAVLIL